MASYFVTAPTAAAPSPDPPACAGEAASEGGAAEAAAAAAAASIRPEDVAAEVQAAVAALKDSKPVGSELCLEAVRRLRQLLSSFDEPPCKEAVAGGCWRRRLGREEVAVVALHFTATSPAAYPQPLDPTAAAHCSRRGAGAGGGAAAAQAERRCPGGDL